MSFKMHPHNIAFYKQLAGYKEGNEETCEEGWTKIALEDGIDIKDEKKKT